MAIDNFLRVLGALSPVLLLVLGAWLKKRADRAINAKNQADAMVSEVTAAKVKAETDTLFLSNAVKLVDEFKKNQAEKDELTAERIAASAEKAQGLEQRIVRMEERFSRLRAILATHGIWDASALIDLRIVRPDYPEPPRLPDPEPPEDFS